MRVKCISTDLAVLGRFADIYRARIIMLSLLSTF